MKLFQSIFGGGEKIGAYPESLIKMATERAVDGTDSRLRLLPGYAKRLRKPVIRAIDHVVALVEGIPAPVAATRNSYSAEPRLAALFSSAPEMLNIFSRDPKLAAFLSGLGGGAVPRVTALLLAERMEKRTLGMDLVGDQVRHDVQQTVVNFNEHRIVDPNTSEADMRRQLMRRAFDHLLSLALSRIAEARVERADLTRQRDLLRRKLTTLERGGWGFDAQEGEHPDPATLMTELDAITAQLGSIGSDAGVLRAHLDIVAEFLGEADGQLLTDEITLYLDPMNIQRDARDPSARRIVLQELRNAQGRTAVMLPIAIAPTELPPREDFVTAAQRYLY
ncbi:hypothetical protein [Thiorhodovibrio frisius]|uniref:Uncharacterized protein n=1 Tax=Thiorhodovibrio frisius TaxID=631362 RepID=H8YW72_9GAMM|nr:hypothetical protein [Thiorhodovibrio frisius]EIC23863.1 hypothetical protein Thi970DRAFT_00378 [Thiorhodovibrio frisius]WPL23227.1 hypothetical protein Thiofri_03412 [Thiorhodovibrio frisius]